MICRASMWWRIRRDSTLTMKVWGRSSAIPARHPLRSWNPCGRKIPIIRMTRSSERQGSSSTWNFPCRAGTERRPSRSITSERSSRSIKIPSPSPRPEMTYISRSIRTGRAPSTRSLSRGSPASFFPRSNRWKSLIMSCTTVRP